MKSEPHLSGVRLLLLVGLGKRGDAAKMQKLGFSGYLTKPLKGFQLYDSLAAVLDTRSRRSRKKPSLITRHSISEARNTTGSAAGTAVRSARILLAEDNLVNQKFVTTLLAKAGHSVTIAENGRSAIEALGRQDYDLVLMDVQMPEMDGFEATSMVRDPKTNVLNHDVVIIAMTANAMSEDRERCMSAGMDDYMSKPITKNQLLAMIEKYMTACADSLPHKTHTAGLSSQDKNIF